MGHSDEPSDLATVREVSAMFGSRRVAVPLVCVTVLLVSACGARVPSSLRTQAANAALNGGGGGGTGGTGPGGVGASTGPGGAGATGPGAAGGGGAGGSGGTGPGGAGGTGPGGSQPKPVAGG